ncbi:MAG: TlpA disulfide reductase family protein, partial [Rubripirellula sp.]
CCSSKGLQSGQSVVILGTSMTRKFWSIHRKFTNTTFSLGKQVLFFIVAFFGLAWPALAGDVCSARHFKASEMQGAGERMEDRTVELTPNQRKILKADLDSRNSTGDQSLAPLHALIATEDEDVPYLQFVELLGSPIVLQEFRRHQDPLVRFRVNLRLAASGDIDSAKLLCKLFNDDSVQLFDARAIRTMLLDIGIQPENTGPNEIVEHLQSLRSGSMDMKTGDPIADFDAIDTDGISFKLSDFRGKTVFIHFWATNCAPCMAQMPELRKRLAALDRENLIVLFVSLDYDKEAAKQAQQELKIPCRHVCDGLSVGGAIARHFRIDRMPVDVIIDPDGKFFAYHLSSLERATKIQKTAEP